MEADFSIQDEENRVLITLSGKIDSTNAAAFEDTITQNTNLFTKPVVIDAADLAYISSAGLRVLLKLKKEYDRVEVINAGDEVYDIFEMTGFKELIPVRRKLKKISVEGCHIIAKGACGKVYRLSDDMICKVFLGFSSEKMIEDEIARSRLAFINNVPCAISYDMVECEEGYGLRYELIKADTLTKCIATEQDRFASLMADYVTFVKKLSEIEITKGELPDAAERYVSVLEAAAPYVEAEALEKCIRLIRALPKSRHFVHNDLHGNNIMEAGGELLLIDMADAATGHKIYDLATIAHAYHLFQRRSSAEAYEKIIGITPETGDRIWTTFCDLYFADTAADTKARRIKTCELMGWLFTIKASIDRIVPGMDEAERQKRISLIKTGVEDTIAANADMILSTIENWQ